MTQTTDSRDDAAGAAMLEQDISHFFGGHVYLKETRIAAGKILVQHRHEFDHLSYLVSGSVLVQVDGQVMELDAPACFTIEAGKHHGVRALTDTVWLCIHSTDIVDADHVDEVLIADPDQREIDAIVGGLQ